ncbi:Hypothetical predicted protein [Pelobates cultripes]|uniref:Uncharacterized protein n=1 Tax=Pelobates cultripes TaxID=61616 RepID=A0AAD1W3E5_PELCU|nr:Hypothetical predicted protein [Pelobates cultripes]
MIQTASQHQADITDSLVHLEVRLDAAFKKFNLMERMKRVPPAMPPQVSKQTLGEKRQEGSPKGNPTIQKARHSTLSPPGPRATWGIPPKHRCRSEQHAEANVVKPPATFQLGRIWTQRGPTFVATWCRL